MAILLAPILNVKYVEQFEFKYTRIFREIVDGCKISIIYNYPEFNKNDFNK